MHISFQLINMIYSSRLHTRGQIQKSGFGSLKGSHVLLFFLYMDCFMLSTLNWICFAAQLFNIMLPFMASLLTFSSTAQDSI